MHETALILDLKNDDDYKGVEEIAVPKDDVIDDDTESLEIPTNPHEIFTDFETGMVAESVIPKLRLIGAFSL